MPANHPSPAFHFTVEWGGRRVRFSEVSGLAPEGPPIGHRDDAFPGFSPSRGPGLRRFSNITLKRGVTKGDDPLFEWLSTVRFGTAERRDLVISLLDDQHAPLRAWRVTNAFPVRVEGPHIKASGNEVAVESIELAHEGLELQGE